MRNYLVSLIAIAAMPVATASAADMPLKAPPPPPSVIFSWTGFYLGTEFGWGQTHTDAVRNIGNATFPAGFSDTSQDTGFLGGFDAGANYQINRFVLGIEGDWQAAAISGTHTINSPLIAGRFSVQNRETDWVSTVTGRVGWTWDRWMLYGKGGAAWRRINDTASTQTFSGAGALLSSQTNNPSTEFGYVVGGGAEWAASERVSVKVEYDWYNFGSQQSSGGVCISGGCGGAGAIIPVGESTNQPTMWEIKGGVNIHFNWWPGYASRG